MSDLYNGEKWYRLAIISRDWNEEALVENTIDAQYKKLAEVKILVKKKLLMYLLHSLGYFVG